jgi:hypothetical protein
MDDSVRAALFGSQIIDLTTTVADVPATARVVTDAGERRPLIDADGIR